MSVRILDVSFWQDAPTIPWESLILHGFYMVIAKSSMGGGYDAKCDSHIASGKNVGMRTGGYHWIDPMQDWKTQARYFVTKINLHQFDCANYDVEQYWSNWQKYWDYLAGKIPASEVPRIPDTKWIDCFGTISEVVAAETDVPHDRQQVYWADWVACIYPKLIPILGKYKQWLADYTKARNYVKTVFSNNFRLSWDQFDQVVSCLAGAHPRFPSGLTEFNMWQFDSKIILPGTNFGLDLNIFPGTLQEFNSWLGEAPTPIPPSPDLQPIIDRLYALEEISAQNRKDITLLGGWASNLSFDGGGG